MLTKPLPSAINIPGLASHVVDVGLLPRWLHQPMAVRQQQTHLLVTITPEILVILIHLLKVFLWDGQWIGAGTEHPPTWFER